MHTLSNLLLAFLIYPGAILSSNNSPEKNSPRPENKIIKFGLNNSLKYSTLTNCLKGPSPDLAKFNKLIFKSFFLRLFSVIFSKLFS